MPGHHWTDRRQTDRLTRTLKESSNTFLELSTQIPSTLCGTVRLSWRTASH